VDECGGVGLKSGGRRPCSRKRPLKSGGVPAGHLAISQAKAHSVEAATRVLDRVIVLQGAGENSFFSEIVEFVREGESSKEIRSVLAEKSKRLGLDFAKCLEDARRGVADKTELLNFWKCLRRKGDQYLEKCFAELDFDDGIAPADWLEWQKEFEKETGRKPLALNGEYLAWFRERQKKADEDRSKPIIVKKARKIARSDPDITAPTPDRDEISEILHFFRSCWVKRNGEIDHESWPTKMDVCVMIGWGRKRVEGLLRGGRHPARNVWRGGSTNKGGAVPDRVTPEGCRRVLRHFLNEVGWDRNESREFLEDLSQVKF